MDLLWLWLGIALAVGFVAGWKLSKRRSVSEMARFEGRVEELQGRLIRANRANEALLAEAAQGPAAGSDNGDGAAAGDGEPRRSGGRVDELPQDAADAADAQGDGTDDDGGGYVEADELTRIRGIGKVLQEKLYDLGVYSYEQVALLTPDEIQYLDRELRLRGRIQRNDWLGQARRLMEEDRGQSAEAQSSLL